MARIEALHVSQYFNLNSGEEDLDFFDLNLHFDSPLFIDPFLIRKSNLNHEKELFNRFSIFFKLAYSKYTNCLTNNLKLDEVIDFLSFKEPKHILLGYDKDSNDGRGLATDFANAITRFFQQGTLAKYIIENSNAFPDGQINPSIFAALAKGVGPDGLSDLTANLMMDYLVQYTLEQCKLWNIPTKNLKVESYFDFDLNEWDSLYAELPENPFKKGQPFILVPKRFLRVEDPHLHDHFLRFLKTDERTSKRFSDLLITTVEDMQNEREKVFILLNELIKEDPTFLRKFLILEENLAEKYDFDLDLHEILSIKRYSDLFANSKFKKISNCNDLLKFTEDMIEVYRNEYEIRDGWKGAWKTQKPPIKDPVREEILGRKFRGIGFASVKQYPDISFIPEAGTGNGYIDFFIVYKNCRIVIELKKLANKSRTGRKKIKSYLHGIILQLPSYIKATDATHGIYVTFLHYNGKPNFDQDIDDRSLISEVDEKREIVEKDLIAKLPNFIGLKHINIDVSPKPSSSML